MIDRAINETVADARWFPLRYDRRADQLHFAWIPPETHRALTFLSDFRPSSGQLRTLARQDVAAVDAPQVPTHLILHSGLAGSTLLARALYQPGTVVTLKEPPIHTDVIAYGLNGAAKQRVARLNDEVTRLLARPHTGGEAIVIKMNSIGNSLVADIARTRSSSQILCLRAPLDWMLASLASRGNEGLVAGRKLFNGLKNSGLTDTVFPAYEEGRFSELQLAAIAWLAIQRLANEAAAEFGPERVRSLSSEQLLAQPRQCLEAAAAHLGLALDIDAPLSSGVFSRDAKTGLPVAPGERSGQREAALRAHRDEIRTVVDWAQGVAETAKLSMDVPHPLLN